tara:strand:- start:1091 stop:1744 length:654 start_codon:yes stop_codon:yes gene_type:complete
MILGIIPARGGSKGVPRKNIRIFNGKPLLCWTIEDAQKSKLLDKFIVSTEDPEIAEISRAAGAEVIVRPPELATDEATTIAVIQDILTNIDAKVIVLLQPTSPIRAENLIDRGIRLYLDTNVDSVAAGNESFHFEWKGRENIPRQKLKGIFCDNGSLYVHKADNIKKGIWVGERIEYLHVDQIYNYEIDTELDFLVAEFSHKLILDGKYKIPSDDTL